MADFEIEKFSPKRAEITQLAAKYHTLMIKDVEDVEGYNAVHQARMDLKNKRVEITKNGKALREDAIAFQRKVIELEKELVGIIEPVEEKLLKMEESIDEQKERKKREKHLPSRKAELMEIGVEVTDDELLDMDEKKYSTFFTNKKQEWQEAKLAKERAEIEERERKLKEEQEKVETEKRKMEEARRMAEMKEQAEKEAREKMEREIREAEDRRQKEAAEKAAKEKEEQGRLEMLEKYKKFLSENGVKNDNRSDFIIRAEPLGSRHFVIYKKISEINL